MPFPFVLRAMTIKQLAPTGLRSKKRYDSFRFTALCTSLAILCLFATGCTSIQQWYDNGFKVGPNYHRPPAAVADVWMEAKDARVSSDGSDFSDWWSVFNDPILDGLILNAYQQNLTLREAGFRVLQAQAERGIAAGTLFPQVQQLNGEYSRIQLSEKIIQKLPPSIFTRSFDQWSTGFNASWELDIWGKYRRMVEAADAELDASVNSYDAILTSLIAEVAATYIEIRTVQQQLEYTRSNVQIQENSLKLTQIQFDEGSTDQVSVEFARANLQETKALVPGLQTQLRSTANRLCVLLGVPPRELGPILGLEDIPNVPKEVTVGIPADLIRRRPDIRAAERLVAAQCAEVGIAEAELYPSFAIAGTLSIKSQRLNELFSGDSVSGLIAPGFQWNILNYGRLLNNIRAYDAELEQAVSAYQETVLEASEEVENSLTGFLNAQAEYDAFKQSTDANLRALDLVMIQFKEGEIDFTPIYVLQNNIASQQNELVQAQGNIALQLISLYKALGGGWQIRCYLDQKCGVITDGFQGIEPPQSGPLPMLRDAPEVLPIPGGNPTETAPGDLPSTESLQDLSDADIRRLATELIKHLSQPKPPSEVRVTNVPAQNKRTSADPVKQKQKHSISKSLERLGNQTLGTRKR